MSILWATSFSESIFESQKTMLAFGSFYLCRWFQLNDKSFIPRLLKGLVLLSIGVVILSFYQWLGIDNSADNAYYELIGISGHKNLFSTVLFLLSCFLALGFLRFKGSWRLVTGIVLVLLFLIIIYLRTRSVYLGVFAGFGLFAVLKLRKLIPLSFRAFYTYIIIGLIVLGILCVLYLLNSYELIPWLHASKIDAVWQSDTGYERIQLWEKTLCVIRQAPFLGVGAGNWQVLFPSCGVHGLYSVELDLTTFQRPHNDWLWVWAETGIIGLVAYLGFFVVVLKNGLPDLVKKSMKHDWWTTFIPLAGVLGFMIIACFSFPKERVEILLLVFTLMGLANGVKVAPKSAVVTKSLLAFIIFSTTLNLYISKERMVGELFMKNVLIQKQQQKWADIIQSADQAYSPYYTIDPTTIPIHWYRGTANFVLGKQDEALRDFLIAEKHTPFNQHIKNDLGTCYEKLGQKEKARNYYREAIKISPLFDEPRLNLGISYYNAGMFQEAINSIQAINNEELREKYLDLLNNR